MAIFDPLFLVALKLPIWGASLATILSAGLLGVGLTILILLGKFSLSPTRKMFLCKPSDETWNALRVGLGSFAANLSFTLPTILLQKWVNEAALAIGRYDTIISVWAVIEKLYQLIGGVSVGFSYGLLPAASFAFGAGRLKRLFWLFVHATAAGTIATTVLGTIVAIWPCEIAQLWDRDPEFLNWARRLIPKAFYTSLFVGCQYTAPALLQAMQRVGASSFLSIVTFLIPLPLFSTILYVTNKADPEQILWSYVMNDSWSLVACALFLFRPIRFLIAAPPDHELKLAGGRKVDDEGEEDGESEGNIAEEGVDAGEEQPVV
jgi:Na+-driven multidrug efflux pump